MKKLFTIVLLICSFTAFAQTAQDCYNNGTAKATGKDYAGSIKDYDKAIKLNPKYIDAWYNRGTSKMYVKDYKGAIEDFTKTLELMPDFLKAITNRGIAEIQLKDMKAALKDFDQALKLDPTNASTYFMRGRVKAQNGDTEGGCADLTKAKDLGDQRADKYIIQLCGNQKEVAGGKKERLMLDWPDSENWKVGDNQENQEQQVIDMIHKNETVDKWTELGNMTSIKGITGVPVDKAMNMMFDQAKKNAPKAKLTFIEKDENAEYPWIIFVIEAPGFVNDKTPESQLWYIVQGKQSLYTNFRAIKKATVPADLREKWVKFFKTAKVVMQ